ncbi:Tricarboxylate transport protein [Pyrenophora teres f. teres]|uniref:Tricarboxylate transport protein n=1 Tax=Pyrenophora teres f. teres TaxID=97479 RepID=A0A6S6W8K9_9PLEO|nr:Tricarboxylate transport protein [Pyrenophora teres f. teres]
MLHKPHRSPTVRRELPLITRRPMHSTYIQSRQLETMANPFPSTPDNHPFFCKRHQRQPTPKKRSPHPVVSLFSGAVAGGVEATTTYPFEFAKTRAQLQVGASGSRNLFAVLSQVAKSEGFGAIYTGCSTLIVGTAFKARVRFLSFDSIRKRLADERGVLSQAQGLLAGMAAGAVESIITVTTMERVNTALIDNAKSGGQRPEGIRATEESTTE